MPNLPRYDSQRQIDPRPSGVQSPGSGYAKVLEGMAQTALDIRVKWEDALTTIQTTVAQGNYKAKATELYNAAINDNDINNEEFYYKELNKTAKENLSGVTNARAREMLGVQLDADMALNKAKIQNIFKKKELEAGKRGLGDNIQDDIINTTIDQFLPSIDTTLNEFKEKGIISEEEADNIRQASIKAKVDNDAYVDPETFLENINEYPLTPKERDKAKENAESLIEDREKIAQIELDSKQMENTLTLAEKIVKGDGDTNEINTALNSGELSSEQAGILLAALVNHSKNIEITKTGKFDVGAYESVITSLSKVDKTTDKILEEIVNSKLKPVDKSYLLAFLRENKSPKNFWEAVREWMTEENLPQGKMLENLFNRLRSGDGVSSAISKAVIDTRKDIKPDIESLTNKGQLMIDANGNKAIVYPDGRIEEVE